MSVCRFLALPPAVIRDFEASGAPDPGHVLAPESPQHESPSPELDEKKKAGGPWGAASLASNEDEDGRLPTDEERATLRLVPTSLPWTAYLICVVEFAERASCEYRRSRCVGLTHCELTTSAAPCSSPFQTTLASGASRSPSLASPLHSSPKATS